MKMTVFVRILAATLLPVFFVIMIVIATIQNVLHRDATAYAMNSTGIVARQIYRQTSDKLESIAVFQDGISKEMASLSFEKPEAKYTIDGLLTALIMSSRDIYSVWVAFEPGSLYESERYYKTLLRYMDKVVEIDDMSDEQLDSPGLSPWYNVPLSTGRVYADIDDYYDFQTGEGAIHLFTMTYPILSPEGVPIGCVGLDIRYEDMFSLDGFADEEIQKIMLVSAQGRILFSSENRENGSTLWDYDFQSSEAMIRAMREKTVWQEETISPFSGEKVLACLYPVEIHQTGQMVYLYSSSSIGSLYSSFYSSMEIIITAGLLGMILLAFSVFFTTRSIVRHVKRITEAFYDVANNTAASTLEGEHIPISATNVIELDILQSALVKMIMQLRDAHGHKLKALEAEMEKEKLIISAETKINFFASMSHEIRTPMNAIMGLTEIILHEGNLAPAQEKHIQDIKISADSLLNVINDILDVSKLETGKMELHPEHYYFRSLIDNIASLSARLANEAGLRFIFECESELPSCLYGDGMRLRQVLLNLIGNAVKFTMEGYVMLRILLQEDAIYFDVIDSGIGIKEEDIASIFDTYKRIDTRRNREVMGTGLGLSITKYLVELMGGNISAESAYGKGSTFHVMIPLDLGDESKVRQETSHADVRYSDTLRVLVVDDEKTNLSVSSGLMKTIFGIQCDTAASGFEAIKKVQETDFDIVFMDHMMPELDGVDTTKRIRSLGGKYQQLPIIALTANAMAGTRRDLIKSGMDDFLAKPIRSTSLREILEKWVPQEKQMSAQKAEREDGTASERMELSDSSLRTLLEHAGIDTNAGMENIGFNDEMYIRSIRLVLEKVLQVVLIMPELLEAQNMRELHIHTHGLRGALASVGADNLSEEVKKLELASFEDNVAACSVLLRPLEMKLRQFAEALDKALPDDTLSEGSPTIGAEALAAGLRRLHSSLEKHDYESITQELKSVMLLVSKSEKRVNIAPMVRLIDSFDYDKAAVLLHDMLAQVSNGAFSGIEDES